MAEENQVQQVTIKEPQQVTKEPQRVTTEDPKKVEAGKRLAAINCKKRRSEEDRRTGAIEDNRQWSEPILWHWSRYSSGSDRQSWLLHLSKQERSCNCRVGCKHHQRSQDASLPTTMPPGDSRTTAD